MPHNPQNLYNQAILLHKQAKFSQVKTLLKQVLSTEPNHQPSLYLIGDTYLKLNQPKQSLSYLQKAISINPNFAPAHFTLAKTFIQLNRLNSAQKSYTKALTLNPNYYQALINLGNIYQSKHQFPQALTLYLRALELKPDSTDAHFNLANTYKKMGQAAKAVKHFRLGISSPPNTNLLNNYALLLEQINEFYQAQKIFRQAYKQKPKDHDLLANLTRFYQHTCNWNLYSNFSKKLDQISNNQIKKHLPPNENPFNHISRCQNIATNFQHAKNFSLHSTQQVLSKHPNINFAFRAKSVSNLRVGYFSNDLRDHPIGHQIYPLFQYHRLSKLETITFSYGTEDNSFFFNQIKKHSSTFIPLKHHSPLTTLKLIHRLKTGILVDTTGLTQTSRTPLLALKPCPIQVSYLGFPGSMGTNYFDYLFTDPFITPPRHQKYYSEKLVALPHCYQISPQVTTQPSHQKRNSQTKSRLILACFNNTYKIDKKTFSIWLKLLKENPHTQLWLYESNQLAHINLIRFSKTQGLSEKQIKFFSRLPLKQHLKRLQQTHLCLDTTTYNGGATSSNAIQAGTPLITLLGNRYVERMSSSILINIGLSEGITHSSQAYSSLAQTLINSPTKLKRLQRKLAHNKPKYPLFDPKRFTTNIEKAYTTMWKKYQSNQKPLPFHVVDHKPLDSTYTS